MWILNVANYISDEMAYSKTCMGAKVNKASASTLALAFS
jgi:hypothetical protein